MYVSDVDIQRWLEQRYGFVPHPFWIQHCKELYLGAEQSLHRKPWHDCPADMRLTIREAFAHFGLILGIPAKLNARSGGKPNGIPG
jgi:hypothetical protein